MNHYISKVKYYIKFCLGISSYGAPPSTGKLFIVNIVVMSKNYYFLHMHRDFQVLLIPVHNPGTHYVQKK